MADDRTAVPSDRPAAEPNGARTPVLLDLSGLTTIERRVVIEQVRTLERSLEAQCPGCGHYVVRRSLPDHLARCIPSVVRTQRLEVIGPDGDLQVVVGELDGETGLAFRDPLGRDRLTFTHGDFGAALAWHLDGTQVIVLQAETGDGEDAESGVSFVLADFNGVPALGWRVSDTGEVTPYRGDDDELPSDEMQRLIEETHAKFAPTLKKLREDEEAWNRTTGTGNDEPSEEELRAILRRTVDKFGTMEDESSEASNDEGDDDDEATDITALTVQIPANLLRRVKNFAALTDTSMNAVLQAGIERYVAEHCPDEADEA